jgi:hypothetical protein
MSTQESRWIPINRPFIMSWRMGIRDDLLRICFYLATQTILGELSPHHFLVRFLAYAPRPDQHLVSQIFFPGVAIGLLLAQNIPNCHQELKGDYHNSLVRVFTALQDLELLLPVQVMPNRPPGRLPDLSGQDRWSLPNATPYVRTWWCPCRALSPLYWKGTC